MKAILFALALALPFKLIAAPILSQGVAYNGVIAYQDDQDKAQFDYIPARVDINLGTTLTDFSVKYWGIGKAFYVKDSNSGEIKSVAGAILSGRATLDMSPEQRIGIIAEIKKTFGIDNPKLLPIMLTKTAKRITPVLGKNTLQFGDNSDIVFPDQVTPGSTFNYTVGTGNSLFAQFVAGSSARKGIIADPSVGINIIGEVEFVGDPWTCHVEANLTQIWNQVRQKYSASVKLGFFSIGSAEYQSLVQDLRRTGAIVLIAKEGTLDNALYGRQIFEVTKTIFEKLNEKATAGDGFFRFEPNPEAPSASSGSSGLSTLWGWGVSVNGSYSSSHFTQNFTYTDDISYTGHVMRDTPISMTLSVFCTADTRDMFVDLRDGSSCITPEKITDFNNRANAEILSKAPKLKALEDRLIAGSITTSEYDKIRKIILNNSYEDARFATSSLAFSTLNDGKQLSISDKQSLRATLSKQILSNGTNSKNFIPNQRGLPKGEVLIDSGKPTNATSIKRRGITKL